MAGEKIKSLFALKELGLPAPEFELVKEPDDIKWLAEDKAYCGWCLRSSLDEGKDIRLPFAICGSKGEVYEKVVEFQKKLEGKATFILYPAWRFAKSGNLLILPDRLIIEAVTGFVRRLSAGKSCDVHYDFVKTSSEPILRRAVGDTSVLTCDEISKIIELSKKIPMQGVVLEWSFSDRNEFHFHDIIALSRKAY